MTPIHSSFRLPGTKMTKARVDRQSSSADESDIQSRKTRVEIFRSRRTDVEAVQGAGCPTANDNSFHRSHYCRLEDIRRPGECYQAWQEVFQPRYHGPVIASRSQFLCEYQRSSYISGHLQLLFADRQLQDAFKDMAKVLRWRILADQDFSLREADLILSGDSLMKLTTLMLESWRKPRTLFICATWVSFGIFGSNRAWACSCQLAPCCTRGGE